MLVNGGKSEEEASRNEAASASVSLELLIGRSSCFLLLFFDDWLAITFRLTLTREEKTRNEKMKMKIGSKKHEIMVPSPLAAQYQTNHGRKETQS